MSRSAILKISSAIGNGLGTGFVIDKDNEGVFVATCGHVVKHCGDDILVDNQKATVVKNHYDEGVDIAILYLKGVDIEPLSVEYDTQANEVKVEGFTYFGDGIKKEQMSNIEAKHGVDVEKSNRKIEILRLTPKEKISNGYSGSPAICQSSGKVVGIVIVEVKNETHTNYAISVKHLLEMYAFPAKREAKNSLFVTEVFDTLNENRLVVLFSQDFTNITDNQNALKAQSKEKFKEGFCHFSVPSFMDDSQEYFKSLATSCGIESTVDNPHSWKVAMQEKLKSSPKRVMLFITDLENGNKELDKQFSLMVRSLVSEYRNFSALFIGKKELAYLVYGESSLSPLNTAKELFFPDTLVEVDDDLVEQQFMSLGKHRASICQHLKREKLGRHKAWSFNEAINAMFWKNLLVKKGKNFAWRDELTKQIGEEVFECDEL
jgi:hypothetical protein